MADMLCCEAPPETKEDPATTSGPPPAPASLFSSWLGDPKIDATPPPPPPPPSESSAEAEAPSTEGASGTEMMGLLPVPSMPSIPSIPTPTLALPETPSFSLGGEPEAFAAPHDDGPQYVRGGPDRSLQSFKIPDPDRRQDEPPKPRVVSPPPKPEPTPVPKRAVGPDGKKGARPKFNNTNTMKLFYMDGLEVCPRQNFMLVHRGNRWTATTVRAVRTRTSRIAVQKLERGCHLIDRPRRVSSLDLSLIVPLFVHHLAPRARASLVSFDS